MPRVEAIYRSSARRALVAVWLFRVLAVVAILYVAAALWRLSQPDGLYASVESAPQGLVLSTGLLALLSLLTVAVRLGALIAFVTWLYRATKNLPALGVADPGVSPGWAIGCWFVPIVNIVAPCIAVLRVWRASAPNAPVGSVEERGWPLLYAWWAAFLALAVAGIAAAFGGGDPAGLLTRSQVWALLGSGIASIVMSLLAIRVVREIERRQTEKSQLQAFA